MKLEIKINKKFFLETVCIDYLLIMGLLSSYIEHARAWKVTLLVLTLLLLLTKHRYREELLRFSVKSLIFWSVVILGSFSIIFSRSNQYVFSNIVSWLVVVILLCLINMLSSNEKLDIRSILKSRFYLLNFFWIANLIVLALQSAGTGFMIKSRWLSLNSFYPDQCSGLFGNSGTHRLSLFTVFMLVYNLSIAEESDKKVRKRNINMFTVITQLWMLYLSVLNDNKTLFVLIPFFFLLFYFFRVADNQVILKNFCAKMGKFLWVAFFVGISIAVFLIYFSDVTKFIEQNIFEATIKLVSMGQRGSGSIERFTIATDALQKGYGLLFGDGLGAAALSESISGRYRDYQHFSMSSMGTLVTLGGVWYYLSFCIFYTKTLVRPLDNKAGTKICWFLCLGTVMALTIYTPVFENVISTLWICLTFIMLAGGRRKISITDELKINKIHKNRFAAEMKI